MALRVTSLMPIDLANPIQRDHGLAQGLQFFGLAVPGLAGGAYLHNLCDVPGRLAQGRHALLSNMAAPYTSGTSGWGHTSRRGGAGELRFDQGNDRGEIANTPSLKLVNTCTIAFAAYVTDAAGCILTKFSNGAGSTGNDLRGIRLQTNLFVTEQAALDCCESPLDRSPTAA